MFHLYKHHFFFKPVGCQMDVTATHYWRGEQVCGLIHDFTASGASGVINMLLASLVPNTAITLFSNE